MEAKVSSPRPSQSLRLPKKRGPAAAAPQPPPGHGHPLHLGSQCRKCLPNFRTPRAKALLANPTPGVPAALAGQSERARCPVPACATETPACIRVGTPWAGPAFSGQRHGHSPRPPPLSPLLSPAPKVPNSFACRVSFPPAPFYLAFQASDPQPLGPAAAAMVLPSRCLQFPAPLPAPPAPLPPVPPPAVPVPRPSRALPTPACYYSPPPLPPSPQPHHPLPIGPSPQAARPSDTGCCSSCWLVTPAASGLRWVKCLLDSARQSREPRTVFLAACWRCSSRR